MDIEDGALDAMTEASFSVHFMMHLVRHRAFDLVKEGAAVDLRCAEGAVHLMGRAHHLAHPPVELQHVHLVERVVDRDDPAQGDRCRDVG